MITPLGFQLRLPFSFFSFHCDDFTFTDEFFPSLASPSPDGAPHEMEIIRHKEPGTEKTAPMTRGQAQGEKTIIMRKWTLI
ncbi:MAG: hypothetical protein ABSD50_13405 [Smithella sp.]